MTSSDRWDANAMLESAGFPLRTEDGRPADEWMMRDVELDLEMVATDLARLPELLSDACAVRFGSIEYEAGHQSIELGLDDSWRSVRVDDEDEIARLLDGFRAVLSAINAYLASRDAPVRVYVAGHSEQVGQPAYDLRVIAAAPSWMNDVAAQGARILAGPAPSASAAEHAPAPRALALPRDGLSPEQYFVVFDSECVDQVEDYGQLVFDLAALAGVTIDSIDYRDGARRQLVIRALSRSVAIDLRGATDFVDLPPLLAGLNELLPGPRYLHAMPELARGQELAVGFFDDSGRLSTSRPKL